MFSQHNILEHAVYAKHRRVVTNNKTSLLRSFSVMRNKKSFDEKSLYNTQNLSIPETLRISEGFPYEIFWYRQTKKIEEKI